MKIAILGANGMLGHALVPTMMKSGNTVFSLDLPECDITNYEMLFKCLRNISPELVINIAAYTNVDGAESHREIAFNINVIGAENVAKACAELSARCFYISTDYVFNGMKEGIYEVDDEPHPLSVYGESKFRGELATLNNLPTSGLVIRTSWLYGPGGKNFPLTMLRLAKENKDLKVVDDQVGSPTYTEDLSMAISELASNKAATGIVHATNSEYCSWFEFAGTIFDRAGIFPKSLVPCTTDEYPATARRPLNSRLSARRLIELIGHPLPTWSDAVSRFIKVL